MNQDVKRKWIEALRSGALPQGTGQLHRKNGSYCCLGVLCEMHRQETGGEWGTSKAVGSSSLSYLDSELMLPREVWQWAELPDNNPLVTVKRTEGAPRVILLSDANDNLRLTFSQIADVIEEQL